MFLYIILNINFNIAPILGIACDNVGTVLFDIKDIENECWTQGNLAKLRLRSIFEMAMPAPPTPADINTKYVKSTMSHFEKSLALTKKIADPSTEKLLLESLVDTIGAHMRSDVLPAARFAYYAGYINLKDVNTLCSFYDSMKTYLNTRGLGWKEPPESPQWSNLTVTRILLQPQHFRDPCARLITKRSADSCIRLPKPKIDDHERPSAIALPLKSGGFLSLTSPRSEHTLLDYYTTAIECILERSPQACRHSDFVGFNNDLWRWMKRDVAPHLVDEKLYAAYGGVLRVAAAAQRYGRGHRDIPETEDVYLAPKNWQLWKKLQKPHSFLSDNESAHKYIYGVIVVAVLICLFQICLHSILVSLKGCRSKNKTCPHRKNYKDVFSAQDPYRGSEARKRSALPDVDTLNMNSRENSLHTACFKSETVYDLNEGKEKLMAIAVSDVEDYKSRSSSEESLSNDEDYSSKIEVETERSPSPPKLDASMTELCIHKSSAVNTSVFHRASLHSDSGTPSNATFVQQSTGREFTWSASDISSSSDQSSSSKDSKVQSRRSREARDVEWARRLIYKRSNKSNNRSNTSLVQKPNLVIASAPVIATKSTQE